MKRIHTEKAPAAIGPYSQAVVHNGVLYTSGQVPLDPVTGEIVGSDIQSQANQVLKNLEQILKEAGTDFSKVIKTTCFLADMKDFAAFNEVYASYITEKPARSCVAVKELPKQVLVEVEVIAAIEE
ncbi:RidA family protein [Faecalicoccus pleomorphus]|uniref:RidA family protein n=1 Tax=Faecalicoccus pleomorphus TaxID=1323 RepID=UPI00196136CF|nr:RidA family protein [Faecalicoccus pleomorphus]MBM6764344.1 RidA family protein [Faecalicoccus pleomorphus]MDB7986737.1 RidA family protein [Faecalicoccus pleomorphus]MDB7990445.1 RidA family protein [Faecalicoccus pleomorphus]MDM8292752.1 RidA family protein [Faecalicoccus pleomorphus]